MIISQQNRSQMRPCVHFIWYPVHWPPSSHEIPLYLESSFRRFMLRTMLLIPHAKGLISRVAIRYHTIILLWKRHVLFILILTIFNLVIFPSNITLSRGKHIAQSGYSFPFLYFEKLCHLLRQSKKQFDSVEGWHQRAAVLYENR